jgi:hypothetical protein
MIWDMGLKLIFLVQESSYTYCINRHVIYNYRLTGKFVFSGKNYREILLKNKECLVPFPP